MTITNYYLNYYNLLKVFIFFLIVGNLARSLAKTPSAAIELILLGSLLFFAIIYAAQNYKIKKGSTFIFLLFLLYLLLHTISASIIRPFSIGTPFFLTLQFNLLEFRLSTLSYFLPLIFIPLSKINIEKFEQYFYILLKFTIIYTIFEQVFSLIGFRSFFESFYMNSGVVTVNQIGVKSIGMYRIWGLIGSPQLLGVFHIMTLFFMLYKKDNFWVLLSIIGIIVSTSKTAYLLLLFIGLLYLLYKKEYVWLILITFLLTIGLFLAFEYYFHLEEQSKFAVDTDSQNQAFRKFMGSIIGFFYLMTNTYVSGAPAGGFIPGGPITTIISYYIENPLEIFLGKGVTYAFMQDNLISDSPFLNYLYLTSEFYIASYFDQYGIIGLLLLVFVFFIYPLTRLFIDRSLLNFIPIIIFIGMFHYPPQISKLMMIIASYALWKIYLYNDEQKEA